MTCPDCGLAEHSVAGCASALRAVLRSKELVIEQCRKALEEAAETIRQNELYGGSVTVSSFVLAQIQSALDSAKGESVNEV